MAEERRDSPWGVSVTGFLDRASSGGKSHPNCVQPCP